MSFTKLNQLLHGKTYTKNPAINTHVIKKISLYVSFKACVSKEVIPSRRNPSRRVISLNYPVFPYWNELKRALKDSDQNTQYIYSDHNLRHNCSIRNLEWDNVRRKQTRATYTRGPRWLNGWLQPVSGMARPPCPTLRRPKCVNRPRNPLHPH